MLKFALLGMGYIANRHVEAIAETNNELVLVYDNIEECNDLETTSINIAETENDFYDKLKNLQVDFVVICTPTFLHHIQILKSLNQGCNVIVEKPICLSLQELEEIKEAEKELGKKVYSLFQLRYHNLVNNFNFKTKNNEIQIVYQGKRNEQYYNSWKGNLCKSGGIVAAVGIHYLDMLTFKYGNYIPNTLILSKKEANHIKGTFKLQNALVTFNFQFLPQTTAVNLKREFIINQQVFDFSKYNNNLHTKAYEAILQGEGITTIEAEKSLLIMEKINNQLR